MIGALGFAAPWLLGALVFLPILWFLLRAVPPAPIKRRFPGIRLLLGLRDKDQLSDKTPWWLLVLRCLAVAAAIIGFSGPVLNPDQRIQGAGPLVILLDASWASASDWSKRIEKVEGELREAAREGREVIVVEATDPPVEPNWQSATAWIPRIGGVSPSARAPDWVATRRWIEAMTLDFDTLWISDGLSHGTGRDAVLSALEAKGDVRIIQARRATVALRPAQFQDGIVTISATRSIANSVNDMHVVAIGPDPNGLERVLAQVPLSWQQGELDTLVEIDLPNELRNRLRRFEIENIRSAGAVSLVDDRLKRREVAILGDARNREQHELLSATHYLERALRASAEILQGEIIEIVPANPDAIILADVARLSQGAENALIEWVEAGGVLVRFAGPRLAASEISRAALDPLMPVRLRVGGRSIGGAMSWGEPRSLRPFSDSSPFFGLTIPEDVTVSAQVMAQPDPDLSNRVIAALSDGTPLVTQRRIGQGRVVLFHVTANAEWSSLPLSGLFVQMLERLTIASVDRLPSSEALEGIVWVLETQLDGFGRVSSVGTQAGIDGEALARFEASVETPAGLYLGQDRRIALNVVGFDTNLAPAIWPPRVMVSDLEGRKTYDLKGWFLALAALVFAVDIFASLALAGRLSGGRVAPVLIALTIVFASPESAAQTQDERALLATNNLRLGYLQTNDAQLNRVAQAGLTGLGRALAARSSIELSAPLAVDLERDELAFFAFLYWPITPDQPIPSASAYAKLNRYLRSGGMIMFDTRDADIAGFGGGSANARRLQQLAAGIDVPPLEVMPEDHVLTRTFYLLQDFPGRHLGRQIWVEAAPPDAKTVEGLPFRNLNDNVTPVIIGGNDWASAWAITANGTAMFPVGRGLTGERQRELALRFGVNLIMHVYTGNYKSDQVHVPALLDRLGQ